MTTKRTLLYASAVVAISAGFYALSPWILDLPWQPIDVLLGHDTEYGEMYSESHFREVRAGMPLDEVIRLLGPPLEMKYYESGSFVDSEPVVNDLATLEGLLPLDREDADSFGLAYSRPGKESGWYYIRIVKFKPDGTVDGTVSLFHND